MQTEATSTAMPYVSLSPRLPRGPRRARRSFGLKVLVVDDDDADVSLILDALRRHPYVSTAVAARSPLFALRQLEAGHLSPDLVLLDIHMPKMAGSGSSMTSAPSVRWPTCPSCF